MVLWQGITEGGTAVPVQVTEAGKVVAEGQKGDTGPEGPIGPKGPPGEYGPGDDVDLGNIEAAGNIMIGGDYSPTADHSQTTINAGGTYITVPSTISSSSTALAVKKSSPDGSPAENTAAIYGDGSAEFHGTVTASNTGDVISPNPTGIGCTMQPGGELYLSRKPENSGVVYIYKTGEVGAKITLSNNGSIAAADNQAGITPSGELYFTSRGTRYKLVVAGGLVNAEPFTREMELRERVEEKRKPRPTDSVPED